MEAERQELALMREQVAEAAMRRLHDPIVINDDDEVLSVGDAEREVEQAEALDCASVEESRRAEDELEHYLLNDSDDEHMEVEARATNRGQSPHDACVAPGSPLLPEKEAAGAAQRIQTQRWTSPRRERSSAPCRWHSVGVMRRRA